MKIATTLLFVIFYLPLLMAPKEVSAARCMGQNLGNQYSPDPMKFAEAWHDDIERLYEAIPALSPKEEKWLEEEINSSSPERIMRAYRSREARMQRAKREIGSELGLIRRILGFYTGSYSQFSTDDTTAQQEKTLVGNLLWLATELSDPDPALYLARLTKAGIIDQKTIPANWKMFHDSSVELEATLRWNRSHVVRHILTCIIPTVMGIEMR